MKRINILLIALFLTLSPFVAQAHGDGGHGVLTMPQSNAIEFAKYRVNLLVENGKIEKSWKPAIVESAEQRPYGHGTEWVVTFKNSKATDPVKSTLYIFISDKGEFIAANFTGK